MKSIFVIIVTTFFGHYINAQVVPFAFIKSPANNITSVVIGNQVWTDKNLEVTTYRNGDPIPEVTDPSAWAGLTTGAWCYYNNDPANGAIYGKLYNWYAVNDSRGLAPSGWHVPSDAEWTIISSENANNKRGFKGLPGGYRDNKGSFGYVGSAGNFWSATESNLTSASFRYLFDFVNVYFNSSSIYKTDGFSVRLVKD